MNEQDLDREPIDLLEIVLPKCINTCGTAPCSATFAPGGQCYNTRATCLSPDDYRDTPDRHLEADLLLGDGDTIASGEITRTADLFAGFTVRFGSEPDGVIWDQGGSADFAAYLGVTSGNLVFRAGDGTVAGGAGVGKVSVNADQFAGKSVTLYCGIDFTASGSSTVNLWVFDLVELTLTLLGADTFTAGAVWAGTDGGAIGEVGGSNAATGEDTSDWNGGITAARFYDSTSAPDDMSDGFRQSLWLGKGVKGEPTNEQYILPALQSVNTLGTKINLSASDDNYRPLGRRAVLDFSAKDFQHSDITQDPYLSERGFDPYERGTFWRKWLARQKFGKVGALVRRHTGYAGQKLSQYEKQAYVLERINWKEDGVGAYCRDVLTRTEFSKAQIPAVSTGILAYDILAADGTFSIPGDVTADYPATGTVRINDEIIIYGARSYNGATLETDFSSLTRGSDGSEADDHDEDDLVQLCRRFSDDRIKDALTTWLVDDAEIEGQFVNIAEIEDEDDAYLDAYTLTGLVTEPTGVDDLVGRLSQECSFYVWWDERSQQIRMKAIRAVSLDDVSAAWTDKANIIGGTFKVAEKPKERLNIINFYYNPRDFAGDLNKASNFKNALQLVNGTTSLPEQYGNVVQRREIYSIFLTTEAQANQTSSRLAIRYADVPIYAEFLVDAKDRGVWVGNIVTISHPLLDLADGSPDVRRWIVVEAEEIDPGHIVRYVCADITLDGVIYTITENDVLEYDPLLFAQGLTFITDNNGLNPDGKKGATIS